MATTVNRYTQPSVPRYNARTLQELMLVPSYKREQHDAVNTAISESETQLAQADGLDLHNPLLAQKQEELYGILNEQAQELEAEGYSPSSKSNFLRFNKQYQQEIGPTGTIGKIGAAQTAMESEKAAYIANATKMGYSPEAAGLNWDDEVARYGEEFNKTGKVSNMNSLYAPTFADPVTELKDLLSKAGLTERDISNFGSDIITQDTRGTYVLSGGSRVVTAKNKEQLQAAVDYVNNQVANPNSTIGKSLEHQRKDINDVFSELKGLAPVYIKDKYGHETKSQISGFKAAANLGIPFIEGSLNYEAAKAETVTLRQSDYITRLDNIVSGDPISVGGTPEYNSDGSPGLSMSGVSFDKASPVEGQIPSFENQFRNKEELAEYKELYSRLQNVNKSLDQNWDSEDAAEAVSSYLKGNQNILRQNFIITDDVITTYGDNSIGVSKTDATKVAKAVQNERQYRRYSIDGKVMSYDDLPSDIKNRENFEAMSYSGYYSPKNFMTDQYGEFEDRKLFVSPIVMQHVAENGKITEVLVSRSEGEMKKPSFKADMLFNDIFVNTNKWPGLSYTIPGSKDEVIYYPEGVPIPGADPSANYMINVQNPDGGYNIPVFLSEKEMQNKLYEGFGVITPAQIKAQNKAAEKAAKKAAK
tara:strand:+ start:18965 stop:20899 length:1935 start_codon:yes stop_codon:yes gene_type:complete